MNVLFLSPWLPWPPFGGALIRILETLKWVAERHQVTLLALLRDREQERYVKELNGFCERVTTTLLSDDTPTVVRRLSAGLVRGRPLIQSMHYDARMADHLWRLTSENRYDIIHVEFSFMTPYLDAVNPVSQIGDQILEVPCNAAHRCIAGRQFLTHPVHAFGETS